jgi:hypothetical protein
MDAAGNGKAENGRVIDLSDPGAHITQPSFFRADPDPASFICGGKRRTPEGSRHPVDAQNRRVMASTAVPDQSGRPEKWGGLY